MKVRLSALVIVLLALLLTACARTPEAGELPVVRYVQFKVFDPVYVAIEEGFDLERGVDIEMIGDVIAGPNAIQAVASGSADAGLSSIPAIINGNANGLPIQGVIDIQTSLGDQALQKWYAAPDSPINSMENLCDPAVAETLGRKPVYAVNIWRSSFHYTSLRGFDQRGLDEDCVNWILLSFAEQIPALVEGSVDVIGLIQPYQSYLEHDFAGQFKTVWTDLDDITGESHVSLIFVNRVWADSNSEIAKAFVLSLRDAINFIEDNPDDARAAVAKYTEIPEYAIPDYHFTPNGIVDPSSVGAWMDYLRERGDLTAEWVTPEMVFTNQYNAEE